MSFDPNQPFEDISKPAFDPSKPFDEVKANQPRSAVQQAISPITDFPSYYKQFRQEAQNQVGRGIEQLKSGAGAATTPTPEGATGVERAAGAVDLARGIGNVALGSLGYVGAPINAALRSVVGKPLENVTGVPKEYPEFAAGLALPIPKSISIPARTAKLEAPTVGALKQAATAGYQSPEVKNVFMHPGEMPKLADNIEIALGNAGATDISAPTVYKYLEKIKTVPQGAVAATAEDVERLRKSIGDISPVKDPTGKITNLPELRAARIAKDEIDKFLPQVEGALGAPAAAAAKLAEARGNTAAAERAGVVDRKEFRAELRAAAANSGRNVSNTMKQRIADILIDPNQGGGFNAAEKGMMERIVRGTRPENYIRAAGNFLGGGGGAGHALVTMAGLHALGPAGVALALPGVALRSLSNLITSSNIDKLNAMIRSNSPLGRKMQPPLGNFGQAAQEFNTAPTARSVARLSIASRTLNHISVTNFE